MEPSKSPKIAGLPAPPLRLVTGLELPCLPEDRLAFRLRWAMFASLLLNAGVWLFVSQVVRSHIVVPPTIITIQRVFLNKEHKVVVIPPKKRVIPHPKPQPTPEHDRTPPPPPQVHLMTSNGPPTGGTAPSGGTAKPGNVDTATTPAPAPIATPTPAPVVTAPPAPPVVAPPSPVVVAPALPTPAPAAPPTPVPPPAPVGPTQDAAPDNQVLPNIPDDLKQSDFKTFVRVKVTVEPDGSFSPILRTSSGNSDIDGRVLNALKQWKWKPALKDGAPIESTQYFKFVFVVD